MFHARLILALMATSCASTSPTGGTGEPGQNPISCPATCQTTYSQCSAGCIGAGTDTADTCRLTCDRVLEDCLRTCDKPPEAD